MQNKGLIKFIAIVFALVSIYQLSFTFIADKVEADAKKFADGNPQKEFQYLDSIGNQNVFLGHTYNDVKGKKVKKGLDLEGGINVVLQVNQKDILKNLSNQSTNAVFNKSLADAQTNREGNQSFLDAFYIAFEKNSNGSIKLASPEIFSNRTLPEVTFDMSNSQVKSILEKKIDEAVESSYRVLRERIDKFGVSSPNIQKVGNSGRILVELPGAKNIDEIKQLLQSTAQLEFWETYKFEEVSNFLLATNELLKKDNAVVAEEVVVDSAALASSKVDQLLSAASKSEELTAEEQALNNEPFFKLLQPLAYEGSSIVGIAATKDTAKVNAILKRQDVRNLLPSQLRFTKFVWGKISDKDPLNVQLYALKGNRANQAPLTGNVVIDAADTFDQFSRPAVSMQMNSEGAKAWEELTGKVSSQRNAIAIVLDNTVYSAPGVSSGPIAGGRSEITGDFSIQETKIMANILKSGKMPASADIVQSEIVGPSLGQQAIDYGILSAVIGLVAVAAWMVFYYGKAGWYANIALIINLLLLFGILASLGSVLTLPGIAGIVLTMGTAVDANIIIFERAKEELRAGKSLNEAVQSSYSWGGAMRAIADANITHILTGLILFFFGTGPIKGFATTLLIGIFTSLFTAIFIARIFIDRDVYKNRALNFCTSITKNWFTNFHFDFIKVKKITYGLSALMVAVSCISFAVNGFDEGVDFVGGRTFQVRFDEPVNSTEIAEKLIADFGVNVEVKQFGGPEQMRIITKYKVDDESSTVDQEVNHILYDGLKGFYKEPISYDEFIKPVEGSLLGVVQASKVSATVSNDIKADSVIAVVGSMVVVFLYLFLSFRKWQYSLGAVASVVHDVIFVLGAYSLLYKYMPFHMEIDQHFIAAILTVIGYSMNDTVIVFDRVREFILGKTKGNFNKIVNDSVNTTLSRTINTSLTLIVVLLIMFIFGGDSIRGFVFAMLIGIIVGTYSSLFLATPILVDTMPKKDKKEIERLHAESNVEA
ncbi:protein translocase subunit SecDF [Flavobacterium agricola]|uniref:Multifunctional fusion protein n=1 Tax=Flavobacterium agricola TaxID=2870839 RepID=A0ABY6LYB9_9FLAO|nr:protein translocase subunit SecDF [Flavobacterium agricola]UYW00384.1 protein translocase subunit SecDF [Flavobacterium agricola]